MPLIHVYGFTFFAEKEEALEYFTDRIAKALRHKPFAKHHILDFHNIRDVSPQSHMYSVTFELPREVAFSVLHGKEEEELKQEISEEFEDK